MVQREQVETAKRDGKKIVLRVDNAIRNSRNRNTGMSRLYDFSQLADVVVYQSAWARDFISEFTGRGGVVIHNGCDLELFKPASKEPFTYLYSRFNRDESKNWYAAWYYFVRTFAKNRSSWLYITGQFSDELREYNFDFYNDEKYSYLGVLNKQSMADLYGQCQYLIYTYINDACSNTLIEALASGCEVVGYDYWKTGGSYELMTNYKRLGRDYLDVNRMLKEYEQCMSI
jgi:glycosyltransferase involved in cell wall biosynthesis